MATADSEATRSTRARPSKAPLSEAAIVEASLEVLKAEGLEAVTMRRVAKALDTGAASLYVYVKNRDDLRRLMFEAVAASIPVHPIDPARWREQILAFSLSMLRAFEDHPGIASVALARVPMGDGAMRGAEHMLALLLAGGIDPQRAAWGCDNLFLIITATAVETNLEEERGGDRHADLGFARAGERVSFDGLNDYFRSLSPERFPNMVQHADVLTAGTGEDRFRFAIETYVDGLVAASARAEAR